MNRMPRSGGMLVFAMLLAGALCFTPPVEASAQPYQGGCSITVQPVEVEAGATVTVTLTGANPGDVIPFTLNSTPLYIGSATADASGVATLVFTVPDDFPVNQVR